MWDFVKKLFGFGNNGGAPLEDRTPPVLNTEDTWPFLTSPRPVAEPNDERDLTNDGVVDPTEKTIAKHRTSADKRKKRKFVKREPEVVATQAPAPAKKKSTKSKK